MFIGSGAISGQRKKLLLLYIYRDTVNTPIFFRRDTFIRDRKLSTGILGKNKRCSVLKFLDVRDELDNLTVYSAKKDSELKDVS